MTSPRQVEANRQNARRSTGPRTPDGKRRSSQNAITHGIFTRAIVLPGSEADESEQEFRTLHQELVTDLEPDGTLETLCVERIAIALWRLRRVYKAEAGEIAAARLEIAIERDQTDLPLLGRLTSGDVGRVAAGELNSSQAALQAVLKWLDMVERKVKETGELGEDLHWFFGDWGVETDEIAHSPAPSLTKLVREGKDDAASSPREQGLKDRLLEAVQSDRQSTAEQKRRVEAWDTEHEASMRAAAAVPPPAAADKLIRYEAHLERLLTRALDQLNQLQRARLGGAEPSTVRVRLGD